MKDLERLLLEELKKGEAPAKIKTTHKASTTRYLLALGVATGIGYATYALCQQLADTNHKPLMIPAAIWGACAASYTLRKIKG